jgi:hypothetical protein
MLCSENADKILFAALLQQICKKRQKMRQNRCISRATFNKIYKKLN